MAKNIVAIGFELASEDLDEHSFTSKVSLLDWDIVLFKPDIAAYISWGSETYLGKPCLDDDSSFKLRAASEHWRREIKQAVESGKTVIVFLPSVEHVYIATGERQYSGTGRNRHTTRVVAEFSNYNCIPAQLKPTGSVGSSMKTVGQGGKYLSAFWAEFGSMFEYKALLEIDPKLAVIATKNGDKPVGMMMTYKGYSGVLVILPDLDFEPEEFSEEREGEQHWTAEAEQFAARFLGSVVALDKALHASSQITPEPVWSTAVRYKMAREQELKSKLLQAETEVEEAQKRKESVLEELKGAGKLRALLYENGKVLEQGIIDALRMLGFSASPFKEGGSEFDVVFEAVEGRLIGEAEGKDHKAINVDKLRQLHMNINEDLLRDEVNAPAKGVLFGNGYRLADPNGREQQFTAKCVTAAEASNTALVTTLELFVAAQYLAAEADEAYAARCRSAMIIGVGLVTLPAPPQIDSASVIEATKDP